MTQEREASLNNKIANRRDFLVGVAAATVVAAGSATANAKSEPFLENESESSEKKFGDKTVAVVEGVLHRNSGGVTEVEIMDNYRIEIESDMVENVKQVTDPKTGRPFVRLEIQDGEVVRGESSKGRFEWRPKANVFFKQEDLPFTLATNGPQNVGGEFPLGSIEAKTSLLTGEDEKTIFTFGALTPLQSGVTRSVFNTCKVYTHNLYGIFCDQWIGDINYPDD